MSEGAAEVNFDGLVGPTHNYAGLSLGNKASMGHAGLVSSPRRAALQGLDKMEALTDLGLIQAVLPPPLRPDPTALIQLGSPADAEPTEALRALVGSHPQLLSLLMSASSMWAANAATVSPSADTADGRIHLTPANLSSTAHRSFESVQTHRLLGSIFNDPAHFVLHPALPGAAPFADEGAANHGRLTASHGKRGTHLFVYGRDVDDPESAPGFPRRQTRLAGALISNSHGLDPDRVLFARQSAVAIDAGAFHNDVVSVVNENVIFTHEHAFAEPGELYAACESQGGTVVQVPDSEVPLADAISSYLFNSQLITMPDRSMALVTPAEVMETPSTAAYLKRALADPANSIDAVHSFDLRESMRNGGGPACLRLRVVMTPAEQQALSGRVFIDAGLLNDLRDWIGRHYRDELSPKDLGSPELISEVAVAMSELLQILDLPQHLGSEHFRW